MNKDISTPDTVPALVKRLIEDYPDNETATRAIAQIIINERRDLINECVYAHVGFAGWLDTLINGVCLGDVVTAAEKRADPSSHSVEHLSKPDTQKTSQRRKRKR